MKYNIELRDSIDSIIDKPLRTFVGASNIIHDGDSVGLLNENGNAFVYIHLAPGQYLIAADKKS